MKPNDESPDLPRREFLRLGIALSAAGALAATATAAPTVGAISPGAKAALGYWPRSATLIPGVAPSTLPAGDPAFEQSGARVTIQGTRSGIAGSRQALLLDFFPDASKGSALPVLAWAAGEVSMGSGDAVPNQPGDTIMQIPVQTVRGSLNMVADFSGMLTPITLSTGVTRGAAKLQSGIYVVAGPQTGSKTLPDLTQWMWQQKSRAEGMGQLVPAAPTLISRPIAVNGATLSVPRFPYIVIEVSYGTLG